MADQAWRLSRRAFIRNGALTMLAASAADVPVSAANWEPHLKIGILTDLHYADTPDRGARNYRTSLTKMQTAVQQMNAQGIDFAVHGGDLIDALPDPDPASEAKFLKQINTEFAKLHCPRHYVLGNHCIFSLTKSEYLDGIERPRSYYSFDHGAFHFVVLDACYRQDGVDYGRRNFDYRDTEIPAAEREWLAEDLRAAGKMTIVFVHQRLDQPQGSEDAIHSAGMVRDILVDSGKVMAVFMGHSHVNDYHNIHGIHYCTLDAVVGGEGPANNAYSVLEVRSDGTLTLHGFCKHAANPMATHA